MDENVKLMLGNNIDKLKELPNNFVDSIVTDPPYGLSFMCKKWDYDVPSVEFWKEVYRVLKPGGHILSFGGPRTYHRMVVNIEDAGFEIRDQIMWVYGSGFPKSLNIRKAVDKKLGNELQDDIKDAVRSKVNTPYEGWGTGLKPANEPIVLARKPIEEKTIAENVLRFGTGGINIDGCRIRYDEIKPSTAHRFPANLIIDETTAELLDEQSGIVKSTKFPETYEGGFGAGENTYGAGKVNNTRGYDDTGGASRFFYIPKVSKKERNLGLDNFDVDGRFPANFIIDETAAELLDEQSGIVKSTKFPETYEGGFDAGENTYGVGKVINTDGASRFFNTRGYNDTGGASRFFYIPKVSKKERNLGLDNFDDVEDKGSSELINTRITKNNHPTVKPINLLTYLVRLITPPNGIVMDCYMGSGSTGIAARLEGFQFIGMEMDEDYYKIAETRINNYELYKDLIKKK